MDARERLTEIKEKLVAPVVVAPMFLVSGPEMVIASAKSGLIGAFPAPNARTIDILDDWLRQITTAIAGLGSDSLHGSWALNLVVHRTYDRLPQELELVEKYRPPMVITALGSPRRVVDLVQSYGGLVLADVNSIEYARKAVDIGVDGLALVSAGAGGHTGQITGFTFIPAIRKFFDGIVIAAGGICDGYGVRAAEVLGADLTYMGTRFIATNESLASDDYKSMVVAAGPTDFVLTNSFTGAHAYYLRDSIVQAGLDPDTLKPKDGMDFSGSETKVKAWKDIWSAGPVAQTVDEIESVGAIAKEIAAQYQAARKIP